MRLFIDSSRFMSTSLKKLVSYLPVDGFQSIENISKEFVDQQSILTCVDIDTIENFDDFVLPLLPLKKWKLPWTAWNPSISTIETKVLNTIGV